MDGYLSYNVTMILHTAMVVSVMRWRSQLTSLADVRVSGAVEAGLQRSRRLLAAQEWEERARFLRRADESRSVCSESPVRVQQGRLTGRNEHRQRPLHSRLNGLLILVTAFNRACVLDQWHSDVGLQPERATAVPNVHRPANVEFSLLNGVYNLFNQ